MHIVIAGNGLAGIIAAKTLREQNPDARIDVFSEENVHYYPRPNLIQYVAGNLPPDRLFAFNEEWYRDKKIRVHLDDPVKKIAANDSTVTTASKKKISFDALLLALGARSIVPPVRGGDKKGIFTFRTLDDADAIIDYVKSHPKVLIVGGGLLGLEAARALKTRGAEVHVIEVFPYLLPRQLDEQGASLLKDLTEKMGLRIHLGRITEEILGDEYVSGLRFKDGGKIEGDMVVFAAGVRPNIAVPREAGIEVDRGVIVDDFLRTRHPRIFAAGDIVQHRGRVYGIIPASFAQARAAALNILGQETKVEETVPSNTLKVVGLDVTSIGLIKPEDNNYEEIGKTDREKGVYKKIVFSNDIIAGAVWMGAKKGVAELNRIIAQKIPVKIKKEALLEDNFDFSSLLKPA